MKFRVIDATRGCAPISGAAVYIWHCDKDGSYSGYNAPDNGNQVGKTFLRGVQVTDDNGEASFLTIYPGWYPGRITHIHFQIYFNDNLRTTATVSSQLAFPQEVTKAVYATADYRGRGQNTSVSSIAADGIFSDGSAYQIAAVTGDASSGLTAVLDVGIAG
ncbi:MAG: protocatechuate dioxygenase [Burkholderiales bacterium]|jgi:protocatechuate 3,4-dioxygenase beta subunit|nr:protocatechuate dioxygenase [Burkholderiales bacterium]